MASVGPVSAWAFRLVKEESRGWAGSCGAGGVMVLTCLLSTSGRRMAVERGDYKTPTIRSRKITPEKLHSLSLSRPLTLSLSRSFSPILSDS